MELWPWFVALTPKDFYKSHDNPRRPQSLAGRLSSHTKAGEVYLKLTVIDDVLIVSFKEL